MNSICQILVLFTTAVATSSALECLCNQAFASANPAEDKSGLQAGYTECKTKGSVKVCEVSKSRCDADTSMPTNCSAMIKLVAMSAGQTMQPYCYTQTQTGGLQGCGWLASTVAERCDRGASRQHWVRRCNYDRCNEEAALALASCETSQEEE